MSFVRIPGIAVLVRERAGARSSCVRIAAARHVRHVNRQTITRAICC